MPERSASHEDERLSALLDDELDDVSALAVTRHLASCSACCVELERTRQARQALRELPPIDPPAALFEDSLDRVEVRRDRTKATMRLVSASAAGLILVSGIAFIAGADDGGVVPPVDTFVADHVARVGGGPVLIPASGSR